MGYILPVRPYQYNHYQRRMRIDSQDPMHIEKCFQSILASQYYDIAREYTDPRHNFVDTNDKGRKNILANDEVLYAQLTGKGRRLNDIV